MSEPVAPAPDRTPTLIEINAQGMRFEAERYAFRERKLVQPVLALIAKELGEDAAYHVAGALRSVIKAAHERSPLPGQKPKPLRPLPEGMQPAAKVA